MLRSKICIIWFLRSSPSSEARRKFFLELYSKHDRGIKRPSEENLVEYLKRILELPGQRPIYLIMNEVDECPNNSGIPSPRKQVLQLIRELVELRLSHLHICYQQGGDRHTKRP